jgi:hypothetical protein
LLPGYIFFYRLNNESCTSEGDAEMLWLISNDGIEMRNSRNQRMCTHIFAMMAFA